MNKSEVITKLADAIIAANGQSFTIDCQIHWREDDDNKTTRDTICYCTDEEHDKLAGDETFDDTIFYYIIAGDGAFKHIFNDKNEWEIVDVYEDTLNLIN